MYAADSRRPASPSTAFKGLSVSGASNGPNLSKTVEGSGTGPTIIRRHQLTDLAPLMIIIG